MELTPSDGQTLAAAADHNACASGVVLGDRNFWAPRLREQLAPFRRRKHDPRPRLSRGLSR